jgi:hypothetical protein
LALPRNKRREREREKKRKKEKKPSTMHNLIQPPDTTHINEVPYKGQRKD